MTATTLNIADSRSTSRSGAVVRLHRHEPATRSRTARRAGRGTAARVRCRRRGTRVRPSARPARRSHIAHALPVQPLGRTVSPAPTRDDAGAHADARPRPWRRRLVVDDEHLRRRAGSARSSAARRAGSVPASSRAGITTEIDGSGTRRRAAGSAGTRAHRYQPTNHAAPTSTNVSSTRAVEVRPRGAGGCSPVGSAAYGFRALSPHDRDPRTTPGVRRRAALAGAVALRRAGRGVGRPALPPAGDGGAQGRGAPRAACGTCSTPTPSSAPASPTSSTRRCASSWAATRCSARRPTARPPTPATWRSSASSAPPLQQEQLLRPLLDGEIRSCFAMTEPWVASSDATNLQSRIERDGDHYVINGHKWWTSGAASPAVQVRDLHGRLRPRRRHRTAASR